MRLLYVTNTMAVGGIETNLVRLTRELRHLDHEVWVASDGGRLVEALEANGVRHITLPISIRRAGRFLAASRTLRRLIADRNFAVVHALSAAANVAIQMPPRATGPLYVSSPMGLQQSDREWRLVTAARNLAMMAGADRLFVISPEIDRHLRSLGASGDRIVTCDIVGIDVDRFAPNPAGRARFRSELGLPADSVLVSTIGALHPRKRHDLFIEAAAVLAGQFARVYFAIAGGGAERPSLEALAARRGLTGRLTFVGERRDVPEILAASEVYVRPGILEGFIGITVLEAMCAGVPVVTFTTNDVAAAVTDRVTGLSVAERTGPALATAVGSLLGDPALAERIAANGRRFARERFAVDAIARALVARYDEALGTPSEA